MVVSPAANTSRRNKHTNHTQGHTELRKLILSTTALIALSVTAARADLTNDQIAQMFTGASHVMVYRGATTTKVEALIGDQVVEVVFNNADNTEISRETRAATLSDLNPSIDPTAGAAQSGDDDGDSDSDGGEDDDNGNESHSGSNHDDSNESHDGQDNDNDD